MKAQTAHSHQNQNAGRCQGCAPLTCLLPWGPAGQLPVSMSDSSISQRTAWQAAERTLCLVRGSLGVAGGARTDFRLRSFAVPVAWPSDPTLPQSRGTGGSCHSVVGHSHREICQARRNGDTPRPLWPGDGSLTHKATHAGRSSSSLSLP